MAKVTVSKMTSEHVPAVLAIEAKCNPAPWSEASFRSELDNPQAHYIVALDGTRLVGYCGCWDVIDEVHVTNIGVDPEFRRKGAGRLLMVHMLALAVERGMRCSTLEVRAGNTAAIMLYESLGYEKCALRKGYYPNDRENAVVMWLYDLGSRSWST
jgi:ribosomal-protein-alanine N-acetyltransferase